MPTIASGASASIELSAGQSLVFAAGGSGTAVARRGKTPFASYALGSGPATIGAFDTACSVTVSAERSVTYDYRAQGAATTVTPLALAPRTTGVDQVSGKTPVPLAVGDATLYETRKAPGRIAMFQLGIASTVNVPTFSAAVQIGLQKNNGYNLKTGSGGDAPMIPLTWGSTDTNDFTNPGGGATTATITDTKGSLAGADLTEGTVWSDWVTCPAEAFTAAPYVSVRTYSATGAPGGMGNDLESSDYPNAEPGELFFGFMYGNGLTDPNYDTSTQAQSPYGGSFRFRYLLSDQRCISIVGAGDSTMQGWTQATVGSIPPTNPAGFLMGYPRLLRNGLVGEGRPATLANLARTGEYSSVFQRRLAKEITHGGYSHALIQIWSINDPLFFTTTPFGMYDALKRCNQMIDLCRRAGTIPIMVEPVNGTPRDVFSQMASQIAAWRSSGVAVLSLPEILCNLPDRSVPKAIYDAGDGIHFNNAGHEAVTAFMFQNRASYGF